MKKKEKGLSAAELEALRLEEAKNKKTTPKAWLTLVYYTLPAIFFNVVAFWLYDIKTVIYYVDNFSRSLLDTVQAIICALILTLTVKANLKLLGTILCIRRANEDIEWFSEIGYGFGVDGEQNAGKSFLLGYIASVLAPERYEDLLVEYYVDCPFVRELAANAKAGDDIPYKVFRARQDSVKFYKDHPEKYPCVYSANGLKINGLDTYELYREHLTGEQRQAENTINVHDEIALMFPNTQRTQADEENDKHKINALNSNTSTERQNYGGVNLISDQRFGEINIALRTTTNIKRHIIAREKLYEAKLIGRILERLRKRILKAQESCSEKLAKRYKFFKRLNMKIGFQCLYYIDDVAQESVNLQSKYIKRMLLKSEVAFDYYHRYYIRNYKAINQKLQKDKIVINKPDNTQA